MTGYYLLVIACGILALAYGFVTSRQVLSADAGTARMQEIAGAVQEGASAYLFRQFKTLAIFVVVAVVLLFLLPIHGDSVPNLSMSAAGVRRSIASPYFGLRGHATYVSIDAIMKRTLLAGFRSL